MNITDIDFEGFVYKIVENHVATNSTVVVTDSDIARLGVFSEAYRALLLALGDKRMQSELACAEIKMKPSQSVDLIPDTIQNIHANLKLTAAQLLENAARDQPLLHSAALTHPPLAKVLEAVASARRKTGAQVFIRDKDGDTELPILEPCVFIQPGRTDKFSETATFPITGLFRNLREGTHGLLLTHNQLPLLLPLGNPRWSWANVRCALDAESYLKGTIVRQNKASMWTPDDNARIESQPELTGIGDPKSDSE